MERAEELARTLVSCARPLRNEERARGRASSTKERARVRGSSMASIQEQFAKIGTDYGWEDPMTGFMTHADGLGAATMADFLFLSEEQNEKSS